MTNSTHIEGTTEAWENGLLGTDEDHVRVADDLEEEVVNKALELQPVSIRLQTSLVEDLKSLAAIHGIGYQPLARQILNRFVDCEKKRLLREKKNEVAEDSAESDLDGNQQAMG